MKPKPISPVLLFFCLSFTSCANVSDYPENGPEEAPPIGVGKGILRGDEEARVAAELTAGVDRISRDGQVALQIVNHGSVTLWYGRPVMVERWSEGKWEETMESRETFWTMELLSAAPGESGVVQPWPFSSGGDPEPGYYRFTKRVQAESGDGEPVSLVLRAGIQVAE